MYRRPRTVAACSKALQTCLPHHAAIQGQMGISTSASKQDWTPSTGKVGPLHTVGLMFALHCGSAVDARPVHIAFTLSVSA